MGKALGQVHGMKGSGKEGIVRPVLLVELTHVFAVLANRLHVLLVKLDVPNAVLSPDLVGDVCGVKGLRPCARFHLVVEFVVLA